MPDDLNIDAGLEPAAPKPRPRRPAPTSSHLDVLTDFAKQNNLAVGSTTGGRHNVGSRHYSGNAMDIKGSGGFDDATVGRLSRLASERGLKLRDERVRPKGQAVWNGAHIHLEYTGLPVPQKQQKPADPLNLDSGLDLDAGLEPQGRPTPPVKPQQPAGDVVSALQKVTDDVNRRMAAIGVPSKPAAVPTASQPNPRNLIDKRVPNMVDALTQPARQPTFEEDRAQRVATKAALTRASTPAPVPQMTQVLTDARNAPDALLKDRIREQVRKEQPAPLRTPWNPQSGPKDEDEIARITDERFEAAKRARNPEMTDIRKEYGQMGGVARTVAQPLARVGGGILKQVGGVTSALGIAPNAVSEWANARGQLAEEGSQLAPLDAQGEEVVRGIPEKVAQGVADLGLGIGQIVLLKKATRLPFNQLMALESALKTSDQPVGERAKAATEAYAMGTALDTHLGRGTSAALFGGPTAIQSASQVASGQMLPEDALIQTGVQAGAGAILGGGRNARQVEPQGDGTTATPPSESRVVSVPEQSINRPQGGTIDAQGLPAGEGNAQASQPTPRRYLSTTHGEVVESANQRRIGQPDTRVRVILPNGRETVVARATLHDPDAHYSNFQERNEAGEFAGPVDKPETATARSFDNVPMTPDELARAESELNLSAGMEPGRAQVDILGETNDQAATEPQLQPRSSPPLPPVDRGAAKVTAPPVAETPPAVAGEPVAPPPLSTTSARQAQMGADRAELDLPELPPTERRGWQESLAAAKPEDANRLADEVLNKPRPLNDKETASLVVRAQQVKNELADLRADIATEPTEAKITQSEVLQREFNRLSEAAKKSGSEKGRTLAAQKLTINQDYDLTSLVARMTEAKGRELTPTEHAQVADLSARLTAAEAERDAANERAAEAELQKQVNRISRQRVRAETKQTLDDEFAQLSQQFRAKMTGIQPLGIDPTLIPVIGKMARNRIKAGITDAAQLVDDIHAAVSAHLPDVTKRDIRDAISGYGIEGQGDKRSDTAKQLADIRTELRNLSKGEDVAAGTRLSRQDAARQKQLQKQEAELTSRMASRNFDKPERTKPVYTRETYAAEKRVNQLKADYEKMRYQATRSTAGKLADTAVGVGNVPKTLLSMGDLSALLRQGGVGVIQHPILSGRAAYDMLRSFTEHGFANVEQAIKSSPQFDSAVRSGVEFTGIDRDSPKLTHREEGYLGSNVIDTVARGRANPLRVVKGVKDFSERTFVSFLDSQRMRIFEQQAQALKDMGLTGKDLDAALKSQAKYINIITGRGSLGTEGNKLAPALNLAMFSPRLVASRFQLLNKMFNPVAWARTPKGARKLQMVDNVKFLAGAAAALGLAKAAGAQVNLDPDDADFLKVKVGNTRFDTLAGLQQPLRFAIRMAKAVKGGETYSGDTKGDIFADFMRSKASPEVGLGWDYLAGSNRLSGKRFEPVKDTARTLIPLPAQDFYEAIKEDGKLKGTIEAIPSLLGVGVQTYKGAAEKPTTSAEKLARRFVIRKMGGGDDEGRTQGEIDTDTAKSELRARVRRGEDISADIAALKSKITERQIKAILGSRNKTRLQEDIDRGGPREAILVYSVATPAQKAEIKDIVQKKSAAIDVMLPDDAAKVRAMYEAQGFQRGPLPRAERAPRQPRTERKSQPEGYLAP